METQRVNFSKTLFMLLIFSGCINVIGWATISVSQPKDSVKYLSYAGKVVDAETTKPVAFASIFKVGTNLGTVSNADGEFVIKVPGTSSEGKLGISYIGYKEVNVDISSLVPDGNVIKLEPSPIPLKEVIIRTKDPLDLLKAAMANIPENYSRDPMMLTSFYRESIKQNRNYVAVSEAILDAYKSSYANDFDIDRIKIYKGRKSMDVKKMDTLVVKLQGGPATSFLMDVVKNPSVLLDHESINYYNYEFAGMIEIDDRQTYVINFDQKTNVEYPLYKGKIYLDEKNLAIVSVEFELSDKFLDKAASELVKKRPANLNIDITGSKYLVNYREIGDKWYFNYVRSELMFKCKWKKRLFKSNYITTLEMAVTDRSQQNVDKYKLRETVKMTDILADQTSAFEDDNFWGEYNTIKPDESIEAAIEKLNKKVQRANRAGDE
ncbi:MAG: carboxypeptidase-like regulatory domain-containing protein [Bacteroidales bacterium]|nr:carboxypeptidase-like regulatory domain-containing protein [Bacteroidales bacterium]